MIIWENILPQLKTTKHMILQDIMVTTNVSVKNVIIAGKYILTNRFYFYLNNTKNGKWYFIRNGKDIG